MAKTVLVVDDDPTQRRLIQAVLDREGYAVVHAESGGEAIDRLTKGGGADVVLLDLVMPGLSGMEALAEMRTAGVATPVIVLTANGGIETVVKAMQAGAQDFFVKPVGPDRLLVGVRNALQMTQLTAEIGRLKKRASGRSSFDDMVGDSEPMRMVKALGQRAAKSSIPVLITGESGVGKEVMARYLHTHSRRADKAFISVNCAAIPDNLLESELFGHEKGAFTGAAKQTKGKVELANGGTFFLDEVGDLPMALQAKLLRFLQDGGFRRVGSDEEVYLDVRVICATQVDLSELCAKGEFRQDLYHRLNVLSLHIPPLRDCLDGLQPLALHFIDQASRQIGCALPTLSPQALERLAGYHWPGNVRQLENTLFQAVSLCEGGIIKSEHIRLPGYGAAQPLGDFSLEGDLASIVGRFEKAVLEGLYKQFPSSRQLGKRLGVSHTTIANKLREHGVGRADG